MSSSLHSISFAIVFSTPTATLDDLFAGQETVTLRNDFNIACMDHKGSFTSFSAKIADGVVHLHNGSLPARYKPVFDRKRIDRITDLWKTKLESLHLKYISPPQSAQLRVENSAQLTLTIHLTTQKKFSLYMNRSIVHELEVEFDDTDGWENIVECQEV